QIAAPANDDCTAPQALTFTSGVATATGDNSFANNSNTAADPSPSCATSAKQFGQDLVYSYTLSQTQNVSITVTPSVGSALAPTPCSASAPQTGHDLIYSYTLTAAGNVTITATPNTAGFNPVIYARKPGACASGLPADELGCSNYAITAPNPPSFTLVNQSAG